MGGKNAYTTLPMDMIDPIIEHAHADTRDQRRLAMISQNGRLFRQSWNQEER